MGQRLLPILLKPLQFHLSPGGPKISHLEGMWEEVRKKWGPNKEDITVSTCGPICGSNLSYCESGWRVTNHRFA